ncbi:MarR family winged helix-turn-helix transcriptional regulator [Aquimarina gracilis]|uniref:MarR family winged helix-turn-helix transcriptional regulator n=1 Tax=Aquimarina gracilis TaxID=874422 RepID=A0ABU5ZQ19_9FLAO|nr:MarR family winged helix-turn-helix transcriptional regulator [Aquimarina gracilis]MEB3344185.1 MarR family winged helix-turn-helix transcriptional regulator [Aquimarina gracilis]
MQDKLQEYGELGLGSRLKRLSEYLMKETQLIYNACNIDFDPYLFPVFKFIIDHEVATTTMIQEGLQFTQPAITQSLKKLSDRKLVTYKTDKADKRKKLFTLTPSGKKLHQNMVPVWKVIDEQVKWLTEGSSTGLTRHLAHIENQFKEKSLSKRILEKL